MNIIIQVVLSKFINFSCSKLCIYILTIELKYTSSDEL